MLLPARSVLDRFTIYDRIFVAIDYDRFLSSNVFSNRSILIWLYLVFFVTLFYTIHSDARRTLPNEWNLNIYFAA